MKEFKNENNVLFGFDDDCFNEHGECINIWALKVIKENNLVEITKEEADAIRNYKTPEKIAEEERLAKLPTLDETLNAKIELVLINLLEVGGMI